MVTARVVLRTATSSISVGASAAFPRPGSRVSELVAAADRALYRAKVAGRNRAEFEPPAAPAEEDGR